MRRFARLPARRLFWAWLVCLCVTLLVGAALLSLAQPQAAGTAANLSLLAPTPTHTTTLTATPRSGTSSSADHASSAGQISPAPSWLVEGLAVLFLFLLGLSLILFPIVVRSARIERRSRPAFSPLPLPEEKQVAYLSQIAPERKEPLSRDQWQALREAAREKAMRSPQASAHLAAMRIVDGVPVSLPIAEAETIPHLRVPEYPLMSRLSESRAPEAEPDSQRGSALAIGKETSPAASGPASR